MVKLHDQWELSIKILSNYTAPSNLYIEYANIVRDNDDLTDIISFLEPYLIKHGQNYFEINEIGILKINNPSLPSLLNYINKLSPKYYERISAILCRTFGYKKYFVTRDSHDQGIDVIAVSDHFKSLFNFESNFKHYFFGQCKKHKKTSVDVKEIRELCGAINFFKKHEFAIKHSDLLYKDFNIKSFSPLHVFFTSGYFFSNNAITLCDNSDIIPLDILDVTFILLKHLNDLNCINEQGLFNKKKLEKLLKEINVTS